MMTTIRQVRVPVVHSYSQQYTSSQAPPIFQYVNCTQILSQVTFPRFPRIIHLHSVVVTTLGKVGSVRGTNLVTCFWVITGNEQGGSARLIVESCSEPRPLFSYKMQSRAQTPPSSCDEKGSGVTSLNPWASGFSLGLFQRALCPLVLLMCPLGLPQNEQCALWLSKPTYPYF